MLRFLESMQFMLFVFFTAAYAYQIVYLFVGLIGKGRGGRENAKLHRYAAVVAARNESAVIAKDRKSTRLNSSHRSLSRMPSSA